MTIKELAKLCGTSRGTVDRVLNNRGKVSEDIKRNVLEMAEKHGYQVNAFGRALVNSQKKFKIAVVLNSIDHEFYQRIHEGVLKAKEEAGQNFEFLIYTNKECDDKTQLKHIKDIESMGVDGLIITPIEHKAIQYALDALAIPIITMVHDLDLEHKVCFVGCNYESNGALAADLTNVMVKAGKVLIVSGTKPMDNYQKRVEGYLKQLNPNLLKDVITTSHDEFEVYQKTYEYLKYEKPALIYFSTYGISGLLQAQKALNQYHKMIAVDETDDVIEGLNQGLISVAITQQPEKQGFRAVKVLKDKLMLKLKPQNPYYIGNKIKVKSSNFDKIVEE